MLSRRLPQAIALLLFFVAFAPAQDKLLTLEDIYHPDRGKRVDFDGDPQRPGAWLPNGLEYSLRTDEGVVRVSALSGETSPLLDREQLRQGFARLEGFSQEAARRASQGRIVATGPGETAYLFEYADDLYHYAPAEGLARLTYTPAQPEQEVDFSPDGRMVSFVRDYNLFVLSVEKGNQIQLTRDGGEQLYNGILDWVYQEEVYGRGDFRAYWWSPDSTRLAFLQLDESPVPHFNIVDHRTQPMVTEVMRYPKAGEPNPLARLGVVAAVGGSPIWVDSAPYQGQETLIVRVTWHPDSDRVFYQVQDREQTWLDLRAADAEKGSTRLVLRETSPAWVNVLEQPHWLEGGDLLWASERSGFRHLYLYSEDFEFKHAVTSGEWEARTLHGVDGQGWVYFSGTERGPLGLDVYRVRSDGSGLTRLSDQAGTHGARFNDPLTMYIDTWSDIHTPTQVRLHGSDGSLLRVIDANPVEALKEYRLPPPEFLQVNTRDGFVMEALLIKPPGFDAARRYPVMSFTYGGPSAPQVRNRWGGNQMLWHQMLAQKGYLVWICDNRTASSKGVQSTWPVHRNMGELELKDLEDGLSWLKQQLWVDGDRIGLWGWSYGGYMTSYALTHSSSFKIGIAGAPVTDWHLYDSIYTERYMGLPQTNPEGYVRSSPLRAAAQLQGKLLLLHGMIDDNVHLQNTVQFIEALTQADKDFEVMFFPGERHGFRDPHRVYQRQRVMTEFILKNL